MSAQMENCTISSAFTGICRLCLCKNKHMTSLYANSGRKRNLSELISICVDLKISKLDGLPDQICKICSEKLDSSYDFRLQCQESNKTLTKLSTVKTYPSDDTSGTSKSALKVEIVEVLQHYTSDDEIPLALVANIPPYNDIKKDTEMCIKIETDTEPKQIKKMKMEADSDQEDLLFWGSKLQENDREYLPDEINDSQYDLSMDSDDCILIKKEKKSSQLTSETSKMKKKKKKISKKQRVIDEVGELGNDTAIENDHFICNICCETSSSKEELKEHKTLHYTYTCKNCKSSYKNITDIRAHSCSNKAESINLQNDERLYSEDCGSADKTQLNKSLYIRMLICHICERQFKYCRTLQYHIRSHTGEKPDLCTWCGKEFREPRGLLNHVRAVHTGEKRFKCSFCPKAFPVSGKRRQHERIHTGERPYQCDLCLRLFTARTTLTAHRRRHTGESKFLCSVQGCNQGFYAFSTFQRHMWAHRGERPYTCTHCGKSYLSNQNLRSHIKAAHTKLRDEVCHVCGKGFTEKSVLNRHLRKIHNFEPKDSKPAPIYGTPIIAAATSDGISKIPIVG